MWCASANTFLWILPTQLGAFIYRVLRKAGCREVVPLSQGPQSIIVTLGQALDCHTVLYGDSE